MEVGVTQAGSEGSSHPGQGLCSLLWLSRAHCPQGFPSSGAQQRMGEGTAPLWHPWTLRNAPGLSQPQQLLIPGSCCPLFPLSALYPQGRAPGSSCSSPAQGECFLHIQQFLLRHFLCPPVPELCWTLPKAWLRWGGFLFPVSAAAWRTFQSNSSSQWFPCSLNLNSFADTPDPSFLY